MTSKQAISRRDFLRMSSLTAAGAVLAACVPAATQAPTQGEASQAPSPEAKTLVMTQGSFWAERFQPTLERYKDIRPEVEVEFTSLSGLDHEEIYAKVLSLFAAGENIDTINAATEGVQVFAGRELIIPLDEFVQQDASELEEYFADVHPGLMETMFFEGGLYSLPWRWNGANMFYNKRLFDEAGIEHPAEDWTKEDFYDIAKTLTKKDASGTTEVFGYQWVNRLWGSWMPWIFVNAEPFGANLLAVDKAAGAEWFWDQFYADDPQAAGRSGGFSWGDPQANNTGNVEALEFMVQLFEEGISPSIEMGGGDQLVGFLAGDKLAMSPGGGFWAGGLVNAGMEPGSFDVQYFPKWKSQAQQIGVAGDLLVGRSELKEEAWDLMKLMTGLETHTAIAEGNVTTVVRRSFHNAEQYASTGPEHWNVFYDCLDIEGTAAIPSPPEAQEMTVMFTKYTGLAMTQEMTAKEALDALQADLEELWARKRQ